jgi:ABC-type glycerol-3-phosphate transport system substrate-binding protein
MEDVTMHPRSAFKCIGAIGLALAIAIGGVGAGLFAPRTHAASVTLTIWYPWAGVDGGVIVNWAKEYSRTHPGVKINTLLVTGVGIDPASTSSGKFLAAVKAGTPPDAALYWAQDALPSLASVGAVQPLDSLLGAAHISTSAYSPAAVKPMTYKGTIYGLPEMTNVRELFWNKDLFKKAGLNPNIAPKTIAQLDQMAQKLTVTSGGKIKQIGFVPWDDQGSPIIWAGLWGASLFDAKGNPTLTNPGLVKLLTWEQSYVKRYGASKINSFMGSYSAGSTTNDGFIKQGEAMILSGEWRQTIMQQYGPKIHYGVAPVPVALGQPYPMSYLDGNTWFISKGAAHADEVLKFIQWTQDPKRNAAAADAVHNISPIREAQPLQKLNHDPVFEEALYLAGHAHLYTQPSSPYLVIVETALASAFQSVQQGKQSPLAALTQAQQTVERQISL